MLRATQQLLADRLQLLELSQALALRRWREIPSGGDWLAAWEALVPRAAAVVALAQARAAGQSRAAVVASLLEQDYEGDVADIDPRAYAGWMESDTAPWQVPLTSALTTAPIVEARRRESLDSGGRMLLNLTHAAIAGAGLMATQSLITAAEDVEPIFSDSPCCQRCAVLVGKRMPFDTSFKRHPQCNGQVVPVPRGKPSPVAAIGPDEVTDLNRWQRAAIEDGADFNRVVDRQTGLRGGARVIGSRSPLRNNGMRTVAGGGRRGAMLPTPKAIYRAARGDRATAQRLLREYGYIL